MPKKMMEYNLLFSCPGDAYSECYAAIKTAVDEFNKYAKSSLSLGVNLTHWSTDSYPQSGGHPQALLNNQIVDSADVAIVVFWTRFGTPTDEYGSGTEEEIERLIRNNKQVFLYFLDKSIPPSMTDSDIYQEQRKQIAGFRKKYENKGLYCVVDNETALKELFSKHLFLYFAKQVAEDTGTSAGKEKSALTVSAVDGSTEARIQKLNLSVNMDIEARKQTIIEKIKSVQGIDLPVETKIEANFFFKPAAISDSYFYSIKEGVPVEESNMTIVDDFCEENGISLDNSFWQLGGLQIDMRQMPHVLGDGPDNSIVGTTREKYKYKQIEKILIDIYLCKYSAEYYRRMDSIPYIELIIQNKGTTFDEDIEISLILPHDSLMKAENFPVPLMELDDLVDNDSLDKWICPYATANIDKFDYSHSYSSNFAPRIPTIALPFQQRDYEEEYNLKKKEYYDRIKELFDWEVFNQDTTDTVKIKVRKLNQFRSMHLPARLFLNTIPDKIEFSITAKYSPRVIIGEITIR